MLSKDEREEFERSGLLRLPSVIPPAAVAAMHDRFWEFLSTNHGIARERPGTWSVESPRHLQALKRSAAFNPMATDQVRRALDDLLGAGEWKQPKTWGLPLVTFRRPADVKAALGSEHSWLRSL
jgi:hypothetical protein